ncbi:GNAT family N-acetyltransferase [Streptomyces sp. NPDC052494]|uniref:GNAT family N-acetyltransferase n=1 Tax=Streptomyces sp. NPDC052494 TaxID=3365692 RepID=UPI0037D8EEF0
MEPAAIGHHIDTVTDAGKAAQLLDDIAPLYEEAFAQAPYLEGPREVGAFIARYDEDRQRRGFRLVLARDGEDLAGFAYGVPLDSTTKWWDGLSETVADDAFTREDGRRTFVIMELAVRTAYRRGGLGRALHAALLTDNPAERVTLAVRPDAEPATSLYAALGYRVVGRSSPWPGGPTYLYMLRLRAEH